jgi:hypothetical protein
MLTELIQTINSSMAIELPEKISLAELHLQLSRHINQLIQADFEKLLSLLYRIDVSETKLKQLLKEHPGDDAGDIIASLIIERQEQKIELRKQHKPGNSNAGDESW